jgi:type IV pilus assembly protein PilP
VKRNKFQRKQRIEEVPNPTKRKIHRWWITLLVAFFFLVAGCGGGAPPSSPPAKTKSPSVEKKKEGATQVAEKKEPEKREPEKKEGVEYSYNPAGKPDPFKPFIQLTPVKKLSGSLPLTPLQKFDVSQLKLVAIISAPEGNIALVEDATGKGYFLKKGTLVGKNDGKVTKILKDKVIIEEVYQDVLGRTKTNEISLSLHKVEEGGES